MRKLLLCLTMFLTGLWTLSLKAQITDKTSLITNPSFETDVAIADLKSCGWATDRATGWTISPGSASNSQIGVGNGSSTIQGIGSSHDPASGEKYLYIRNNWNANTEYSIQQTIPATNLPAGRYILLVKTARYASANSDFVVSIQEDGETAVSYAVKDKGASNQVWQTWDLHLNKKSATTALTIKASMTAGSADGGQHYCFLLDDFQLIYVQPSTPMDSGTSYYLYNEAASIYLSAGSSWGTHAFADGTGLAMTATLSDGTYTLAPDEYSGKKFTGLYVDGNSDTPWYLVETSSGSGKYYMTQDGQNFLTATTANAEVNNSITASEYSEWTFVSKEVRKTSLLSAEPKSPVNATFLIADPNFGRNNGSYSSWIWTFPNGENKNNSGANENFVVESYHKQFTFKQILSSIPAGVYSLTAQGFYRQDGSDNDHLPLFFANEETQTFPLRTGTEGSMSAASNSFSSGNYVIEPIYVRVEENTNLEIGAKLEGNANLWCIWDNFQLSYYGDYTIAQVKMADKVAAYNVALAKAQAFVVTSMFEEDWNALQNAITSNLLDLNSADLTEEQVDVATTNLTAANTEADAAVVRQTTYNTAVTTINGGTNVNLTNLITNNGFEQGSVNGWTNSGSITANSQSNSSFDNKNGNHYAERWHTSGTIDLNQTIAYLPAGIYKIEAYMYSDTGDAVLYANNTTTSVSTSSKYSVVVEIGDKESIKLGGSCTLTDATWICMDEFTLTYVGTANDLTYTLATGKMGTDKSAAQTAAETTFNNDKNLTNYNALLAAISDAEASVANYNTLKSAIDKANDVVSNNNFVTSSALTSFQNVIDEATTGWTNVSYTDAEATAKIAALGTAVSGWHAIESEGAAGAFITSTWGKTSENWWSAPYINTWSIEGDNDGTRFSVPFFEYYTEGNQNLAANTFTATMSGLENGRYQVEIWARVQRRTDADFNSNNSMITMNVNNGTAVSIMEGQTTVGSGNTLMRLGRYTAIGDVTDGTLTLNIDVKLGANVHWLCWRDVKYTKLDEASMTITDAKYGTFVAPFDVTIPDGVTAYTVNEGTNSTLELTEVNNIEANKPVLVYSENQVTAEKFYGVAETTGNVTNGLLVGVYARTAVPAGDYVLQKQNNKVAFYRVADGTNVYVGANRAYLSGSTSNGVKAFYFSDEDISTGINAIDALVSGDGEIFNAAGIKTPSLQKGFNIIRTKDGKTQKVFVK